MRMTIGRIDQEKLDNGTKCLAIRQTWIGKLLNKPVILTEESFKIFIENYGTVEQERRVI
jgi:hypothetical protein